MQLMALRMRRKNIQVFIIAPDKGHEFARACNNIGGTFVSISPASPNCINVMEIRPADTKASDLLDGYMTERSELAAKIQSLHIFFSLLIPDMSHEEKQLLDEAMVRCYQEKGITHDNQSLFNPERPGEYRKMPILGDLHKILLQKEECKRIANILNRLVSGSASSFNQQTNVDLKTNMWFWIFQNYPEICFLECLWRLTMSGLRQRKTVLWKRQSLWMKHGSFWHPMS